MKKLCLALISLVIFSSFIAGCGSDGVTDAQIVDKRARMDKNVNDAGAKDHLRN